MIWRRFASAAVLTITAACSEQERLPTAVMLPAGAAQSVDSAFFFYEGRKVRLEVEAGAMVIEPRAANLTAPQNDLAGIGVRAAAIIPIQAIRGHFEVSLAPGFSPDAALRAASLRTDEAPEFVSAVYRVTDSGKRFIPLNGLTVRFHDAVTRPQIQTFAQNLGLELVSEPSPDEGRFTWYFRYPRAALGRPLAFAADIETHALVAWADPERLTGIEPQVVPPDPLYPLQHYLKNTTDVYNGIPVDINAEPAWNLTTGAGIRIAVLDDGIDISHPDFGPVTDTASYDVFNGVLGTAFAPAANDDHGTPVAGIIFARHNSTGVAGIAPAAGIRSVRLRSSNQGATASQLAAAIQWSWSTGAAHVVNGSIAISVPSTQITNAINDGRSLGRGGRGTVFVFAAGNYNSTPKPVAYPANLPGVVAVGAITKSGPLTYYSGVGPEVDIVAPSGPNLGCGGGDILTLDLFGPYGCNTGPGGSANDYTLFTGTSAATPQVAGVAALIIAMRPTLSEYGVRQRLCGSARAWGPSNEYGCGKLDAGRALTPNPTVSIGGSPSVKPNVLCGWTASVSGGLPPYHFNWTVNGTQLVGQYLSSMTYTNTGSNFTIGVTVSDAVGGTASSTRNITVSPTAKCFY
jgi:subtilisin family serine protease